LAGALVAFGAMFEVFMLNMTYDVPVKLFSFHLVAMSVVLVAPYAKPLGALVFRPGARSWWAAIAQTMFGVYLVGMAAYGGWQGWKRFPGAAKPPLYGIWTIEKMTVDGVERAPLVTDWGRWRRLVVQNKTAVTFWRMDDTTFGYGATVDEAARTIALSAGNKQPAGKLSYQQPSPDRLVLAGDVMGQKVRLETRLFDRSRFLLVSRGFHWIQETPFNR
jgi:hypothetical protein